HVAGPVLGPAEVEDALRQRGFARVDVGDDADVAQLVEHSTWPALQGPGKRETTGRARARGPRLLSPFARLLLGAVSSEKTTTRAAEVIMRGRGRDFQRY